MFAKKSLGQNFLKSQPALKAIVVAANLEKNDVVLEVGPGKGVLTKKLLAEAVVVHAVEKDDRLIEVLQETFVEELAAGKLFLHHADILESDSKTLGILPGTYKIVANIPYYITGQFFRKFLTETHQPSCMVVMVQKEVAERIVARDGKESILSISIKAYGTPKYVMTVQKKYFSPEPNVDSAIIAINNISRDFFNDIPEEKFFEIVRLGFAHKRKVLIGNLSAVFPKEKLQQLFTENSILLTARAEDIPLQTWRKLISSLVREH